MQLFLPISLSEVYVSSVANLITLGSSIALALMQQQHWAACTIRNILDQDNEVTEKMSHD